jgi:predicted nucleotidyltransferase component of viral defense system
MEILTEFQKNLIRLIGKSRIRNHFFLSGGTTLAFFYLQHRYSEDLDFFTEEEGKVAMVRESIEQCLYTLKARLEVSRESKTFFECFLQKGKERLKLHFAQDIPYRLQPIIYDQSLGIYYDNELDISCNKFSALFDRHEAKDFVDIYFLSKEFMDFWEIYKNARKKHIGMEPYWLAVSLDYVTSIKNLPRMIKPVTIKELQEFYYDKIRKIMEEIKGIAKYGTSK